MNELIRTNSLLNLAGGGRSSRFKLSQNLRKDRGIWYKIKLICFALIKKISSLLSVDYYESNEKNQFKDIQLQLHATNSVSNPYTFSIQGNTSFSGICEVDKFDVIAHGSKPWYNSSRWPESSKVSDLTLIYNSYGKSGGVAGGGYDDITIGAKFNVKGITDLSYMFGACRSLITLDLSNLVASGVTTMSCMFSGCEKLRSINFNNFDTSSVSDMHNTFYKCTAVRSLDLSSFNTSNVTNMSSMFAYCISLTSLDLSSFNTSNVTNIDDMFLNCKNLQTLDYLMSGYIQNSLAPDLSGCTNLKTLRLHHATPSYVDNFIVQSKVPSTCNVIQVS